MVDPAVEPPNGHAHGHPAHGHPAHGHPAHAEHPRPEAVLHYDHHSSHKSRPQVSNFLAIQLGILTAFLLVCACLTLLSQKGWAVYSLRRRFSLWDLLVAVTLAAALTGLIVGIVRDKEGPRDWRFRDKDLVEEWQRAKADAD